MKEKKQINAASPDLSKLQAVVVDHNTMIYIPVDADPEEAKERYQARYVKKKQ